MMGLLLSAILGGLVALVLFKLWGGGTGGPVPPPTSLPLAQTRHTTVYIFPDGAGGLRVNAAPEILFVRPGDSVAWTVVDATGRASGNVTFRIKEGKNPFEQELGGFPRFAKARIRPDAFRDKGERVRYAILVNGEELFDPELQMEP
jgi:hypothetical protein